MNYCEQAVLYYYDELDLQQRQAFKAHLDACPACQRELAFLKASSQAMQPSAAPQQLVENVFNATTRRKTGWFSAWKPVMASAVLIAAGFLMLMVSRHNQNLQAEPDLLAYAAQTYNEDYEDMAIDFAVLEELYSEYLF